MLQSYLVRITCIKIISLNILKDFLFTFPLEKSGSFPISANVSSLKYFLIGTEVYVHKTSKIKPLV